MRAAEGAIRLATPLHAIFPSLINRAPPSRAFATLVGAAAGIAIGAILFGYGPSVSGRVGAILHVSGFAVPLLLVIGLLYSLASDRDGSSAALARTERLIARLSSESPSAIIHFDALGRPLSADMRWSELTGLDNILSSEDRWLDAVAPEERGAASSLWARARATLDQCTGEFAYLRNGEACGYAEIAIYPEVHDGKILGFAARLTDITPRRLDQAAQFERESRYRLISEHAQDVILRLSPRGDVRYVSGGILRVTGHAPVEMIGHGLIDYVHEDDAAVVRERLARLAEGLRDPSIDFRLRHRDGHYTWFEASLRTLFDRHGEPFELVASLRDIGRRRRAEAAAARSAARAAKAERALAIVADVAEAGHWRFDPATRRLDASPQVHHLLRQRRDDRLRPATVLDFVRAEDRRVLLACLARARRSAKRVHCTIRLAARGEERVARIFVEADRDGEAFLGWSGVAVGVTAALQSGVQAAQKTALRADGEARWTALREVFGPAATAPRGGRQLRVLVAEEDVCSQVEIVAIVGRMGHAVTIAETGRQAVAAAGRDPYDVILMDMQLPGMDGLAATRAIRASAGPSRDATIIALTSDASPERTRFTAGTGFSHVLTKPVERAALAQWLGGVAVAPGGPDPADRAPGCPLVARERIAELRGVLGQQRVNALLGMLVAECVDRPSQIRTAFDRGELAAIRAEGHGLKGAALSIGATALGRAAEQLEIVGSMALAEPLIAGLEECAQATRAAALALLQLHADGRASA